MKSVLSFVAGALSMLGLAAGGAYAVAQSKPTPQRATPAVAVFGSTERPMALTFTSEQACTVFMADLRQRSSGWSGFDSIRGGCLPASGVATR